MAEEAIERIVACVDGTWTTDQSNTNVARLVRLIAAETTGCPAQRRFYDEGVGTRLGERIKGGMFGIGLDANIRQGYAWLGSQYAMVKPAQRNGDGYLIGPDIFCSASRAAPSPRAAWAA